MPSNLYNIFEQGFPVDWKNVLAKLIKPLNKKIPLKLNKNKDSITQRNYKDNESHRENKISEQLEENYVYIWSYFCIKIWSSLSSLSI